MNEPIVLKQIVVLRRDLNLTTKQMLDIAVSATTQRLKDRAQKPTPEFDGVNRMWDGSDHYRPTYLWVENEAELQTLLATCNQWHVPGHLLQEILPVPGTDVGQWKVCGALLGPAVASHIDPFISHLTAAA